MPLRYEVWDVFAARRFEGNPLAVVSVDEADFSASDMQTIAREFNLSETVFVLPARMDGALAALRIFTPVFEMPFAGHPTVGAALALAAGAPSLEAFALDLPAGRFRIDIHRAGGETFATFENPNPPKPGREPPPASAIAAAATLPEQAIGSGAHRPRRFGCGADFVYARVSPADLKRARVDSAAWTRLDLAGAVGLFLYAEGDGSANYLARMFAPDAGVVEDPATGSAACAFPGQIAAAGDLADGAFRWTVLQGADMGRPSWIDVSFDVRGGEVGRVRIGGGGVRIARGELYI